MKWATRADVHLDRVASAWLIRRFIDAAAEFQFVEVGAEWTKDAIPFALPGAAITGHDASGTTFEKLIDHYELEHPGLPRLAQIVRVAVHIALEQDPGSPSAEDDALARSLLALSEGLLIACPDDAQVIERGATVYDLLLSYLWGRIADPRQDSLLVFWDRIAGLRARRAWSDQPRATAAPLQPRDGSPPSPQKLSPQRPNPFIPARSENTRRSSLMSNQAHLAGPATGVSPKLHHATYLTAKLDEMVTWYGLVAGMKPVYHDERGAWMTNDEANHRIALVAHPLIKPPVDKPHQIGHHHTAFEYPSFQSWIDNYVRLKNHAITPFMALDHGLTLSLYYADPEGNGVEIQVDNFENWEASTEWLFAAPEFDLNPIGAWVDPDQLVEAWNSGMTAQEIHEKAYAGEYQPAEPPADILLPEVY